MSIYNTELNENVVKLAKSDKAVLAIVRDIDSESPREWDNLGTMMCFHRRYSLGDKTDFNSDDFSSWNEVEEYLRKELDAVVVLRLDLYDHSGITMHVGKYNGPDARWDSGQVGFIYATKEDIRKNWELKRVTKKYIEWTERILRSEVKTYNQYLTGEVYGFVIETPDGEDIDSCYGFYGCDIEKNGMKEYIDEEYQLLIEKLEDRY